MHIACYFSAVTRETGVDFSRVYTIQYAINNTGCLSHQIRKAIEILLDSYFSTFAEAARVDSDMLDGPRQPWLLQPWLFQLLQQYNRFT